MVVGDKSSFQANAVAKKGESVTRRRYSTTEDSMGGRISQTTDDQPLKVIFNQITAKDIQINEMGLAVVGNLKIYFDADQDIIEGDTLIDSKSIEWYVETITAQYTGVYSVAVVRNISLKGS